MPQVNYWPQNPQPQILTSAKPSGRFGWIDLAGYLLIFLLGAFQFFSYLRTDDMVYDARYIELAQSLLQHGSYQFNFRPETLFPPGLPAILALAWSLLGHSQAILYHIMSVSTMLGLAVSFELLRRTEGRSVALISCLLLGSSAALFSFATELIFSDPPYFFVSMLTLLLALKLDGAHNRRSRAVWIALLSISTVMAVLLRSAGVALLVALCGWIAVSFLGTFPTGWRRLRLFCIPLLLGCAVQLLWTKWTTDHQFQEWPVPGYPHSYLSQLKVKNGNEPQLGLATLRDIPERIEQNLDSYSVELVRLLTRKAWINPYWCSAFVAGVIALITLGLSSSLLDAGGQPHDWYFAIYSIMYLVWPWNFEMRFLLPVAPLACLYFWRGGKTVAHLASQRSIPAGVACLLGGSLMAFFSAQWAIRTHQIQPILAVGFWSLFIFTGVVILTPALFDTVRSLARVSPQAASRVRLALRVAGCMALAFLVEQGVAEQVKIARYNFKVDTTKGVFYPSIEAAQWIKSHEPVDSVVMARKQDLVVHYSHHQVIWFPPVTDTGLLMQGIRRYHVSVVVVSGRDDGYWRPSEERCFRSLLECYPKAFRLVHQGPDDRVFEVQDSNPTS